MGNPLDEHLRIGDPLARIALECVRRRKGRFEQAVLERGVLEHFQDLRQVLFPYPVGDPTQGLESDLWVWIRPEHSNPSRILEILLSHRNKSLDATLRRQCLPLSLRPIASDSCKFPLSRVGQVRVGALHPSKQRFERSLRIAKPQTRTQTLGELGFGGPFLGLLDKPIGAIGIDREFPKPPHAMEFVGRGYPIGKVILAVVLAHHAGRPKHVTAAK